MAEVTEHTEAAAPPEAASDADAAPAPGEPPPFPPTAAALAGKAKDLQALRDAVVDAASVGAGLWFSYLFVLLYLLIAVGGVTHRDLFLESPVKLPFLNVDLPLLGFFVLGPLIFIIVHAYVLLHFVLLAGKVGDFDAELRLQIADEKVRKRLRRQLPSNIFVQFLAGPREVRRGILGFLLRRIADISLVLGPIALLVFFELQFLPYHNEAITWWHRIAVAADIALLWMLWPSVARGERAGLSWRDLRRSKIVALAFASLAPILVITTVATIPDEWPQNNLPSLRFIPWKDEGDKPWRLASLYELLVAGEVDLAARKPKSIWSNRLVLPGFDAIDHVKFDSEAKIAAVSETVSLRARHLEGAVLIGAKLRKADFTSARLQSARLDQSDLRDAKFNCAQFGITTFDLIVRSELQIQRSPYPLQPCAQLQGATLDFAQLQGVSLWGAQLQGAMLIDAGLQGATLDFAQLQGATLDFAQLQGATLDIARLQGASLDYARLQGASLREAQLQGASLREAQLQGASLHHAKLQGALLWNVFAWRTDARNTHWGNTSMVNPETGPKKWSAESFEDLKKLIAENLPDDHKRSAALERIEKLDPSKALKGEDEMAKVWEEQARSTPDREVYNNSLAELLRKLGCSGEGAPYVLRGLLRRLQRNPFEAQSPQPPALAKTFLDEEHCPSARGLSDDDKARLKAIRDRPPPPAPKQ